VQSAIVANPIPRSAGTPIPQKSRLQILKSRNATSFFSAAHLYSSVFLRRSEFVMTDTELKLMAVAARIGLSSRPKNG
jgi:hypothetical protein